MPTQIAEQSAKLGAKHRAAVAERAFMRKAVSLGFAVAKPLGNDDRCDVIVRYEDVICRVQVKSVTTKTSAKAFYRVRTIGNRDGCRSTYLREEIDFLAAYVFPENMWYIFPASVIEHREVVYLRPGCEWSDIEQYREAWRLMKAADTEADSQGENAPLKTCSISYRE